MLTRIEIDGFKTFRDFKLDIPPFMVVIGKNSSGKSNFFDAIRFLTEISSGSLVEAVHNMRRDLDELLHLPTEGNLSPTMSFAVEVLLDTTTHDDFGEEREVTHSRVRYEVTLEARSAESGRRGNQGSGSARRRLFVKHEHSKLIRLNDDQWVKAMGWNARDRQNVAPYSHKSVDTLLNTETNERGQPAFKVHQDGRAGRTKSLPAQDAAATVLSTLTTMEYLHLWALKSEMKSWRQLHLEPESLRSPSSFDDDDRLRPNGANLANVLYRISEETASDSQPQGALPAITSSLSRIIPEITDVRVVEEPFLRKRTIFVSTSPSGEFSANVASDGTLRTLGLLAALYDPSEGGLICFEEPENGIYPRRLLDLMIQLYNLAWASVERRRLDRSAVVNQLVVSSHSPLLLKALRRSEPHKSAAHNLVFFDLATRGYNHTISRVTRSRVVVNADQGAPEGFGSQSRMTEAEIASFEVASELD